LFVCFVLFCFVFFCFVLFFVLFCFCFLCFVCPNPVCCMHTVSLVCSFLISALCFSNVYFGGAYRQFLNHVVVFKAKALQAYVTVAEFEYHV